MSKFSESLQIWPTSKPLKTVATPQTEIFWGVNPEERIAGSRALFIIKKLKSAWEGNKQILKLGHNNSSEFLVSELRKNGKEINYCYVDDLNQTIEAIKIYKPQKVILGAVYLDFDSTASICEQFPDIQFYIRCNSDIPFLSETPHAIGTLTKAVQGRIGNLYGAFNKYSTYESFSYLLEWAKQDISRAVYLPNSYLTFRTKRQWEPRDIIDIGCFGALRTLKNILPQAMGASIASHILKKKLRFHINYKEGKSAKDNLSAIQSFFSAKNEHELIVHPWLPRDEFLALCGSMDIGLQVSLSETFNMVSADLTCMDVPVVGSSEIEWLHPSFMANPNLVGNICQRILYAYGKSAELNYEGLCTFAENARQIWLTFLEN